MRDTWKKDVDDLSAWELFRQRTLAYLVQAPMIQLMAALGRYESVNRKLYESIDFHDLARDRFGDYEPDAHDVFVCTFPKSGTNWMMQMAYQIAHRGAGDFTHIYDVVPWPDGEMTKTVTLDNPRMVQQSPTGLRVIKTHLGWEGVPYSPEARYIYVMRDPKDVYVSNYFFFKDVAFGPIMPPSDDWFETFISDYFVLGSWAEHICGYWQQRHRDNVLIMTFGEMKADRDAAIRKVAAFMEVPLTDDEFAQVHHKTGFAYMQSQDDKFNTGAVTPIAPGKGRMMRKGKRGSSGEILSREQQRRTDAYFRAALATYGCDDFPYSDFFEVVE